MEGSYDSVTKISVSYKEGNREWIVHSGRRWGVGLTHSRKIRRM